MEYVTHRRDDGAFQRLSDHVEQVAQRAYGFAQAFGAAEHARQAGLLHDIGKYSRAAQARQRDPEHTARVDHSTAGAQVARERKDLCGAFAVAGHHAGLMDAGSRASAEDGTLWARLNKTLSGDEDPSDWRKEVYIAPGVPLPQWLKDTRRENRNFAHAFYTRMLFSCLVDADFLDTEDFMQGGDVHRGNESDMQALLDRLRDYVSGWLKNPGREINRVRNGILTQCLKGDERPQGLYTLTIPTGGGKTVASLAFALSHAVRHGLKRVIYVIPYTSIIEQNAAVFKQILGEENVLEHHANVELDDDDRERGLRMRLAAENWDAPVIVTTSVQFFESLYAAKTSRCRKLHNIAQSVVIFDEAQMLPVPYLQPCVDAIAELVEHYGVTAVLCTATQPALMPFFHRYAPTLECHEIAQDADALVDFFRRVHFQTMGVQTASSLAAALNACAQTLCIVNTRKMAQEVYRMLDGEGAYHLSTLMTPEHRTRILEEIRARLREGRPCRVISTSLIEAGVDVDFPEVWREEAGIDSILQAAGRCNREGRRDAQNSVVHIFRLDDQPPRTVEKNVYAARRTMDAYAQLDSREAIHAYFQNLYGILSPRATDIKNIVEKSGSLAFKTVAEAFHLIEDATIPVYIPTPDNAALLEQLRAGEYSRSLMRRLGRSAVNVYPEHFQRLAQNGVMECREGGKYGILLDPTQYSDAYGLTLEPACSGWWFA